MNRTQSSKRQRGLSIIEALIALVIMGFGILSLAGMHTTLTRNVDTARQRTEAVRLAQEKIEELRSFTGIDSTITGQSTVLATARNWDALASSTDSITTNVTYARAWTFAGAISDTMRSLTVTVSWTDRTGEAQAVTLNSVISKTNPSDTGFLGFPLPLNTNLKRPKDRNLDIPIRAIDIGNGQSALKYGTSGQYVVFGNITGDVVKVCTPTLPSSTPTDAQLVSALNSSANANCTDVNGYIITGYIARDPGMSNTDWDLIKNSLAMNVDLVERHLPGATAKSCSIEDATDQTTGAVIANQKSYLCIIPLAEQATTDVHGQDYGPYHWSGKIRVSGPSLWAAALGKYFVCQYDYDVNSSQMNTASREYYPQNKSIDQQNFLVGTTNNGTASTAAECPTSMSLPGVSTGRVHQDCRSASNPTGYTTACPTTGAASYAVTYDGNQSDSGTVPVDVSSPYSAGTTVTVKAQESLLRSGYTFNGWNTSASGVGLSRPAGSTFTMPSSAVTLYAQWTAVSAGTGTYTVTYHKNDSSATGLAPIDLSSPYAAGSSVTVLSQGTLAKANATFSGWTTNADGTGQSYAAASTFTISANVNLYAKWLTTASVLTAPTLTWPGNGNNIRTLTWSPVSNATGYTVYSCSKTNTTSSDTCQPTSADPSQTATTKNPPSTMQELDMYCYTVVATAAGSNNYTNSVASNKACIFRQAGNNTKYSFSVN